MTSNDEVCLTRRKERDVRERGRTEQSVVEQFEATVAPMARRYVHPTIAHADVVVIGTERIEDGVARVVEHYQAAYTGMIHRIFAHRWSRLPPLTAVAQSPAQKKEITAALQQDAAASGSGRTAAHQQLSDCNRVKSRWKVSWRF